MTALLQVSGLRVHYAVPRGAVKAVDGVSFSVRQGEALGLVGESGSGKSSLALALMRLLPHNVALVDGQAMLEGVDCLALEEEQFRKEVRWRQVAMVFQGALESLNPVVRVGHQVAEPLALQPGVSRGEARAEARRLLEAVRLSPEVFQRYPHELSGGMKQRALIAMALVLKPRLLILDEPTSALDVSVQAQIMNMLKSLKRELGLGVVFITHDIALASDLCDAIGVMYAGKLAESGPADRVLTQPQHPYTQRLLAAVPRLHGDAPPQFVPGAPPDLADLPIGCAFHPRCPHAFDRCRGEEPPALDVGPGHLARCWLLESRP